MTDREKVIRAVETCFDSWIDKHRDMGLDVHGVERLKREALELLKEQEITVQPERRYLSIDPHRDKYMCSRCGDLGLRYLQRFCGGCGKEVDWLDRI